MTTDLFAQVKEIPFEDVLSFYGIKQTRGISPPACSMETAIQV